MEPIMLTLGWTRAPNAEAYDVQVATDPSFTLPVAVFSALPDTSCAVSLPSQMSTYYWCVRARNTLGVGPWSQTYKFIVNPLLPWAVVVLLQSDGADIKSDSTLFNWRSQPNADRYWFENSSDSLFSQSSIDSMLTDTTVTIRFNSKAPEVWWRVRAHGIAGWGPFSDSRRLYLLTPPVGPSPPSDFRLDQNYPNPFNPRTTIQFTLARDEIVRLEVFDLLGRSMAVLISGLQRAGMQKIQWDASEFPSGFYFYRMQAGAQVEIRKFVLLK
jgi:hypothetical protein